MGIVLATPSSAVDSEASNDRLNHFRKRTTQEVFYDHLEKRKSGLVEEDIAQNYSPAVVQLTCTGIYRGHEGVREGSKVLKQSSPRATLNTTIRSLLARWRFLSGEDFQITNKSRRSGFFLIRDGWIVVQTIHYKVKLRATNRPELQDSREGTP